MCVFLGFFTCSTGNNNCDLLGRTRLKLGKHAEIRDVKGAQVFIKRS